jgi:hypothetical protein
MRSWAWQNLVDWWSLAHAWGWLLTTYALARATRRLRFAVAIDRLGTPSGTRWQIRVIDRPTLILVCAVLAGIGWEVVEATWIEPWLHFREPWGNRLADIVLDALGAWVGIETADRTVVEYRTELGRRSPPMILLHPDMKLPWDGKPPPL